MRKRIIALNGGLGNQMFQYAFARMLEDRKHCLIEFDTGFYSTVNDRKLAIQNYNIHKYDFCNHEYYNKIRLLFQKIPFVAWLAGTYKEYSEYQLDPRVFLFNYRFYYGYWQNKQYFENISNDIRNELSYIGNVSEKENALLNMLEAHNAIAIHVRRGDYTQEGYNKIYISLSKEYYKRAVSIACKELGENNIPLYVFSDDIDWCKANLADIGNVTFVDNTISSSADIDMLMMKKARCLITANSTFGWWSAWLSDRDDKIVLVPDKWLQDEEKNTKLMKAFICDKWKIVPV